MTTSRRLQLGLGLLWLADAALQCQPFMFTARFADTVLRTAAAGQPAIVSAPSHLAAEVVASAPAAFNVVFVVVQLGLGLALLFRRTARAALIGSVVWGLAVWLMGEGLGGLAGGHLMLLTGGPGAALLYAVVAVVALRGGGVAAWVAIWVAGAAFQLLPGQNTGAAVADAIADAAGDAPAVLHAPLTHLATGVPRGPAVAVALGLVQLLVGLLALVPGGRRAAVAAGLTLSTLFFVAGQSVGELTTGRATDPNAAVVLALLGLALVPTARATSVAGVACSSPSVRPRTVLEPIPS